MAVYETGSRAETAALGERLAKVLRSGSLVLFTGGLGAGKTAFCEGIARGLGCTDEVSSPTFAIVNVYRGPQPFAHFDMYRISTMEDLPFSNLMHCCIALQWVSTSFSLNTQSGLSLCRHAPQSFIHDWGFFYASV